MTTFVKQYGERRTGTNYLRALLLTNYAGVVPLMHILGDKHSVPVDFDILLQKARAAAEPAWEFIRSATLAAPAESTVADDPARIRYMKRIAEDLVRSAEAGTIAFIVSSRHPYAWAASLARYSGWTFYGLEAVDVNFRCRPALARACLGYSQKYRVWLDHHARFDSRSVMVRHEDLVADAAAVLLRIEKKFDLQRSRPELDLVRRRVLPADWDDCDLLLERGEFNRQYYDKQEHARQLSPEVRDLVDKNIDWDIAADLGYSR